MKIFLDFDGVFNIFPKDKQLRKLPRVTGFEEYFEDYVEINNNAQKERYDLMFCPERDQLFAKVLEGHEVYWMTTWIPWINNVEAITGITGIISPAVPSFSSIAWLPEPPNGWKEEAVRTIIDGDEPFVWVDDEDIPYKLTQEFKPRGKLIRPESKYGLTRFQITAIEKFLKEN